MTISTLTLFLTISFACTASQRMEVDPRAGSKRCCSTSDDQNAKQTSPHERFIAKLNGTFLELVNQGTQEQYTAFLNSCHLALTYYQNHSGDGSQAALLHAKLHLMQHIITQKRTGNLCTYHHNRW